MRDLAEDVGLFAMNAFIDVATRMDEGATALGAVAGLMQSESAATGPVFQALVGEVESTVDLVAGLFYPIAATKLQAEMLNVFLHELLDEVTAKATMDDLGALAGSYRQR